MSFAHYLLQVNLYLIVFYGFFKLWLDKETYFTLNRFYLVGAGILSLAIPFIRLEWLTQQKAAQQVYTSINWEAVLQKATIVSENNPGLNWANILVYIYCAGILFFMGRLVVNLFLVKKLIANAKSGSAFSFFTNKVVDKDLPLRNVIDMHEEAHIKQWHTLDILFFEILGILTWINPIIYFYKKSIKNIHEFLADEMAAAYQGDKAAYAMLILSQSLGISPNTLTNGFFNKSLMKKRILMLQKERSKKIAILKYGISIPLFAILIVFSSATIRKNEQLISLCDQIPLDKSLKMMQKIAIEQPEIQNLTPHLLAPDHGTQLNPVKEKEDGANLEQAANNQGESSRVEPATLIIEPTEKRQDLMKDETKIYDFVSIEKQPEFPGGLKKFYEYLSKSIKYPALAQENNVQGKVFLSFTVEKDGEISDIKITRGLGSGTDEEAIRVIENSPKWNPGMSNGEPVRVKYNINVNFKLNTIEEKPVKSEDTSISPLMLKNGQDFKALVLVDGVKLTENNSIVNIDPNTIESIEVLKTKEATALYGAKAKEGVILITTKTKGNSLFKKLPLNEFSIDKSPTFLNRN